MDLRCGIYRHYKGKEYLVLGVAKHSETGEILVAYIPLYAVEGPQISVRPYQMFIEKVVLAGKKVSRFKYIRG